MINNGSIECGIEGRIKKMDAKATRIDITEKPNTTS
jgi:hypothetical protein